MNIPTKHDQAGICDTNGLSMMITRPNARWLDLHFDLYMYDFGHKFCDSVLVHYFVEAHFYVYHVNYVENSLDCINSALMLHKYILVHQSGLLFYAWFL